MRGNVIHEDDFPGWAETIFIMVLACIVDPLHAIPGVCRELRIELDMLASGFRHWPHVQAALASVRRGMLDFMRGL